MDQHTALRKPGLALSNSLLTEVCFTAHFRHLSAVVKPHEICQLSAQFSVPLSQSNFVRSISRDGHASCLLCTGRTGPAQYETHATLIFKLFQVDIDRRTLQQ